MTNLLEQHTIGSVPLSDRHGRIRDQFTIWFAANVQPLTVITGALGALFGLSLFWCLVAIVAGNLIGAVFMALHAAQGPKLGVPQMIQGRGQFGLYGSALPTAAVTFMYVGFFAAGLLLAGASLSRLSDAITIDAGIVIAVAVTVVVALVGYDLIHALNRYAVFLFGGVMALGALYVIASGGIPATTFTAGSFAVGPFLAFLGIVAVWQIAYAPYVSDYSRYLPSDTRVSATFWLSYWGTSLGTILAMAVGAVVALAVPGEDVVGAFQGLAGPLGGVVVAALFLGITNACVLTLYGGTLCTLTMLETLRPSWLPSLPVRIVVMLLVVATSLGIAFLGRGDFMGNYELFVLALLYLLVPWTAINLVDFYLIRRGNYDVASFFQPGGGIYGTFNWRAVLIYAVTLVVQIPFLNTSLYRGPLVEPLGGADLSWILGLVVAGVGYYLVARGAHLASAPAVGQSSVAP